MLHHLRKRRHTWGRALCGVLALAWLVTALQPCLMTGSPVTHHVLIAPTHSAHGCCLPVAKPVPVTPHCSPLGCDVMSTDHQSADQQLLARFLQVTPLALLLCLALLTKRRIVPDKLAHLFAPPPPLHPTLAYCTLLI